MSDDFDGFVATVINTNDFINLSRKAARTHKNRVPSDELINMLDPNGIHVLTFHMIHNDIELRTMWLTKIKNSKDPVEVFLDMEFEDYNKLTKLEKHDEEWNIA